MRWRARLDKGRWTFVSLQSLDNGYPRMHHKFAALSGAGKAGSRVLNLGMIML